MSRFYNITRTPLSASDTKGNVVHFSPKTWTILDDAVENSASIRSYVLKGFLKRELLVKEEVKVAVQEQPPTQDSSVEEIKSDNVPSLLVEVLPSSSTTVEKSGLKPKKDKSLLVESSSTLSVDNNR